MNLLGNFPLITELAVFPLIAETNKDDQRYLPVSLSELPEDTIEKLKGITVSPRITITAYYLPHDRENEGSGDKSSESSS